MPADNLQRFRDELAAWEEHLQADEWHFVHLREQIVKELSPQAAFALINEVVPLLLEQKDDFGKSESGALLLALAGRADTSELPPTLAARWDEVVAWLAPDREVLTELGRWYRKPAA